MGIMFLYGINNDCSNKLDIGNCKDLMRIMSVIWNQTYHLNIELIETDIQTLRIRRQKR